MNPRRGPVDSIIDQILWSPTMLAAEHDDSELVCDSLKYVEPYSARCAAAATGPGRTCEYR